MDRNKELETLVGCGTCELYSGQLAEAGEELAETTKALLFGHYDELNSDVFDEGCTMQLHLHFKPGALEVSVPKLEGKSARLDYGEIDDASLRALAGLVQVLKS